MKSFHRFQIINTMNKAFMRTKPGINCYCQKYYQANPV